MSGFPLVLLGFTEFYRVFLGHTEFFSDVLGFLLSYRFLLSVTFLRRLRRALPFSVVGFSFGAASSAPAFLG